MLITFFGRLKSLSWNMPLLLCLENISYCQDRSLMRNRLCRKSLRDSIAVLCNHNVIYINKDSSKQEVSEPEK